MKLSEIRIWPAEGKPGWAFQATGGGSLEGTLEVYESSDTRRANARLVEAVAARAEACGHSFSEGARMTVYRPGYEPHTFDKVPGGGRAWEPR